MNFIIPLVIYPFDIMFSFSETDDVLEKALKKYKIDIGDAPWKLESVRVKGRTCVFNSGQTLIRMPNIPSSCRDYGTLQHEIFHAIEFLFDRISVQHHIDSGECWAYLIGYITEEVYKKLNR